MLDRTKALIALALVAIVFWAGWAANGWRLSGKIESLKHAQTKGQLENVTAVANDLAETHGRFVDALQQFQATQQANQLSQQDLRRVLLDLRGFTSGLHGDFADLPRRIERAKQPSVSTQPPAQPYSKQWQQEVQDWQKLVQESRSKLKGTQLMLD